MYNLSMSYLARDFLSEDIYGQHVEKFGDPFA
jgi:hypothetical protein